MVLASCGSWLAPTRTGIWQVGQLMAPTGTPVMTFTDVHILKLDSLATPSISLGSVIPSGCRPSRIASTISGAGSARRPARRKPSASTPYLNSLHQPTISSASWFETLLAASLTGSVARWA